jgi:hypothetical protein
VVVRDGGSRRCSAEQWINVSNGDILCRVRIFGLLEDLSSVVIEEVGWGGGGIVRAGHRG